MGDGALGALPRPYLSSQQSEASDMFMGIQSYYKTTNNRLVSYNPVNLPNQNMSETRQLAQYTHNLSVKMNSYRSFDILLSAGRL